MCAGGTREYPCRTVFVFVSFFVYEQELCHLLPTLWSNCHTLLASVGALGTMDVGGFFFSFFVFVSVQYPVVVDQFLAG